MIPSFKSNEKMLDKKRENRSRPELQKQRFFTD